MVVSARVQPAQMNDDQVHTLLDLIRNLTGIAMTDAKRQLVERRLSNCMVASGINDVSEYIRLLEQNDTGEVERFCNAVTTNLTAFFREAHHFRFLAETLLPTLVDRQQQRAAKLRIWSAGCSTGEEPYSIAMTLLETIPDLAQWDAKVLCTDIDTEVIEIAAGGVYPKNRVEDMDQSQVARWFLRGSGHRKDKVQVKPALRELLTFRPLNLMGAWPMSGPFDVIFCRNVIIYFDRTTQQALIDRFADYLPMGGYLILGHSESLHRVSNRFRLLGKTVYQRVV